MTKPTRNLGAALARRMLLLFAALTLAAFPALADICVAGYTGGSTTEIFDTYGLTPNLGTIAVTDPAQDLTAAVNDLNSRGARAMLLLDALAFYTGKGAGHDCSDYFSAPGSTVSRLYKTGTWKNRVDTFLSTNAHLMDSSKLVALSIHSEANNSCAQISALEDVAAYIKFGSPWRIWYEVPLAVGYPMTVRQGATAKPLPAVFPDEVDLIGTWDYGIFNPTNDNHPNNFTNNWSSRWSTFESKLQGRDALIVLNAFCDGGHVAMGWVTGCTPASATWPMGVVSDRWRDWALTEPSVIGLSGFAWGDAPAVGIVGTRSMDPSVRASHQTTMNAVHCTYNP